MRGKNYMTNKNYESALTCLIMFCILALTSFETLHAQVQGTQEQKIKWMKVGSLHHWFSNGGAEIEYGRRGRTGFLAQDQLDGLNWPGEYIVNKGVNVGKSLWIGTTNFLDPVSGKTYPHKVINAGRININLGSEIFADDITLIGNKAHPTVYVDDSKASDREYDDEVDKLDSNLPADRMVVNKFHTSIGVSVTRKILAFTQQYHDNYFIYEYVFKNTGAIDATNQKKLDKTLTGVVFHFQYRYGFAGESYLPQNAWAPTGASWGLNTINDCIGQDAAHPGEFRAAWSYYGPVSGAPSLADDIGLPRYSNGSILAGTCYAGVVVLYADKSTKEHVDDTKQPFTTLFMPSDRGAQGVDQYDQSLMTRKYVEFMTAGHPAQTHAEQVGKDANGWPSSAANSWGGDAGGYAAAQAFGPYDMAPGDSVKIIVAEGVAGIMKNRDFVREIAQKWFNNSGPFTLPNGSSTTNRNTYKNTWVLTGKDSLFQTFRRAVANYKSNYTIPKPPPAPNEFKVNSGGDKIFLKWANNAESWPTFNGYKIYRAEGRTDTTYNMIFSCDKANAVNSFEDKTAKRGFNYFYYIVTKDNGSTNNVQTGVPLVSSKFYTMTNKEAFLTRPAGSAASKPGAVVNFSGDGIKKDFKLPAPITEKGIKVTLNNALLVPRGDYTIVVDTLRFFNAPTGAIQVSYIEYLNQRINKLQEIRIVPNPYHIKARSFQFGNDTPDRLAFYNLPPLCKIKIYTETGDLVETIDHTNSSGDELWHSLTSSRQLVVSGLYIAYIEVTEDVDENGVLVYKKGDNIIKKFIIIR
jgi:hypothetical protein